MDENPKRKRIRLKQTPEKRTEKELRQLGITLQDVPTGGRGKRTPSKYSSFHGQQDSIKDAEKSTKIQNAPNGKKSEQSGSRETQERISDSLCSGSPVRKCKSSEPAIRTPRKRSTPQKQEMANITSSVNPTESSCCKDSTRQRIDCRNAQQMKTLKSAQLSKQQASKEQKSQIQPAKNKTEKSRTPKKLESTPSQTSSSTKNQLASLKKILVQKARGKMQGKVSKHTGIKIKLKRLQNGRSSRKIPRCKPSYKSKITRARDARSASSNKDHKKSLSPRKQLKKDRAKVKLALDHQKYTPQFDQLRRKKLRSEISDESELWEGFPVDLRMPRLRPISPVTSSTSPDVTIEHSNQAKMTCQKVKDENSEAEIFIVSEGNTEQSPQASDNKSKGSPQSRRQLFAVSPTATSSFENILKNTLSAVVGVEVLMSPKETNSPSYFGNPLAAVSLSEFSDSQSSIEVDKSQASETKQRDILCDIKNSQHTESLVDEDNDVFESHMENSQASTDVDDDTQESHGDAQNSEADLKPILCTIPTTSDNDIHIDIKSLEQPESDSAVKNTSISVESSHTQQGDNSCNSKLIGGQNEIKIRIELTKHKGHKSSEKKKKNDIRVTRLKAKTPQKYGFQQDRLFQSLPERSSNRHNRLSITGRELLMDNRLAIHACALWSSDQRRGFQQRHSGVSSAELDVLMREAWEALKDKEKVRYFIRAKAAVQDRAVGKNASRSKKGRQHEQKDNGEPKTIEAFRNLPPDSQDKLLQRKMIELQQKLTAATYSQFVQTYYSNFSRSKFCMERLGKQRGEDTEDEDIKVKNMARKLLFQAIMTSQDKLSSADQLKAAALRIQINARYHELVDALMVDDAAVKNSDHISERMSDLIEAIKLVETCSKMDDADISTEKLEDIVHSLKEGTSDDLMEITVGPSHTWTVPSMADNTQVQTLLDSANVDESWMQLSSTEIEEHLQLEEPPKTKFIAVPLDKDGKGKAFTIELSEDDALPLLSQLLLNMAEEHQESSEKKEKCCELDSPSCAVTTLLLSDAASHSEHHQKPSKATHRKANTKRPHVIHAHNAVPFPRYNNNSNGSKVSHSLSNHSVLPSHSNTSMAKNSPQSNISLAKNNPQLTSTQATPRQGHVINQAPQSRPFSPAFYAKHPQPQVFSPQLPQQRPITSSTFQPAPPYPRHPPMPYSTRPSRPRPSPRPASPWSHSQPLMQHQQQQQPQQQQSQRQQQHSYPSPQPSPRLISAHPVSTDSPLSSSRLSNSQPTHN